jgi:hypothetical protein
VNQREYRLWAFDTEDDGKGGFILGAVTNGSDIWYFETPDSMREFMEGCPDPYSRFIAHNLEYDLGNVYRGNYDLLRPKWNRSRLLWAEAKGMRARYFNSFCHAPIKLAEMGEIIGLPKLEIEYHKLRTMATSKIKPYLSRDVEILWKFMDRLQVEYLEMGGRLCPTAPGSAMAIFRNMMPDYCAKRVDEDFLEAVKPSYYGGRTEAFYKGRWKKPFHYSDVHSMYPWTMLGDFPNFHIRKIRPPKEGECGVLDATVRVKGDLMPPLPCRDEKLIFPEGRFRGLWTREEIDRSTTVQVEKVHGGITFPVSAGPVLGEYVRTLWKKRTEAKTPFHKWLYKLLMNSLYGKFASSPSMWTLISEDEYIERSNPIDSSCICNARKVWDGSVYLVQEDSTGYPIHTNYIWPALITGRARMRLWEDARMVRNSGGEVFYCDTDSLIYHGRTALPDAPGLGEWGTETHKAPSDLEIRGPKMYRIGDEYRVKGVPGKSLDEYGKEHRPAKEFFEKGRTKFRRPVRMREALRRASAKKPGTPDTHAIPNYWIDVEKVFGDGEGKRIWNGGPWSEPVRLDVGKVRV